jgi:uncharacterized protein (TIGR03085 family)
MPKHALAERSELAASLRSAGPDQPTLCGEWSTNQLAAHLVLRERSVTELAGRVPVARLQALAQRHIDGYVAANSYEQIVTTVGQGPPAYSPFALPPVRETVNLLEYLIHAEDVRRAAPQWQVRAVPIDRQRAIWSKLRLAARLTMRSMPGPVEVVWPSHGRFSVGRGPARVVVTGDPVELALLAFGRQRVAQVDYTGEPGDIEAVRTAKVAI